MVEDRARTGVLGLDDLIEGGLPRGFSYAVRGGPGSGKTIFSTQFLYKGATMFNENGIYVTFEEPPYSISNNMMRFNWNLYDLEDKKKLTFVDASPIEGPAPGKYVIRSPSLGTETFDIGGVISLINDARKQITAKRCVIDSLSALGYQYREEFEMRRQVLKLVKALTEMGLTTFIISENREERQDVSTFGIESFLPHGVLVLHMVRIEDAVVRALELRKIRGVRHSEKLVLFRITSEGIEVYPNETIFGMR